MAYIEEKGVEIPKDYLNMSQESLEDFVYMVVQHHVKSIEEGKHEEGCKIVISYTVNYDFAMAICKSLPTGK